LVVEKLVVVAVVVEVCHGFEFVGIMVVEGVRQQVMVVEK